MGALHESGGEVVVAEGAPLICGAALFGAGWGWSGICPGPAFVAASAGAPAAQLSLAAVAAGSLTHTALTS